MHAAFYSLADGEAARHIPSAWETAPPEVSFGRIHHLPKERLAEVMAGLRERGRVDADGPPGGGPR